jgi:hypothetical protein
VREKREERRRERGDRQSRREDNILYILGSP